MSNKRRIIISIHHRDQFSLGEHRTRLGHAAYHWGILIQPKNPKGSDSDAYDVTDAAIVDPLTRQNLNPNHDWHFRPKVGVNPHNSGRLLGRVMIGKMPNNVTNADIEHILRSVPLPVKNASPEQNCVTWTLAAIQALQQYGLAEAFDKDQFMLQALQCADRWAQNPNPQNFYNYTDRRW